MSTINLIDRCRRMGIKLTSDGERLRVDAPRGVVDADLRADLTANKVELLAALTPPPDPLADPIFMAMSDRLHEVIGTCDGERFADEHGRRWDTLGTASELYMAPWSMPWLDEVEAFAQALSGRG